MSLCPHEPLDLDFFTHQASLWLKQALQIALTMKREYRQADSKSQISHSRLVRTLASTLVTWLGYSGWIPPKPNHSSVFCQMGSELCWQSINSGQLVFLVPKSKWFWQHPLMPSQQKIYISYKPLRKKMAVEIARGKKGQICKWKEGICRFVFS